MISAWLHAACAKPAETPEQAQTRLAAESAAARQAIEAVNAEFGNQVGQGNVDRVVALYTDDAVLLPPNMPVASGREAIKAVFAGMMAMKPTLTLKVAEVVASGSSATERGTYTMTVTPPGATAPITDTGKYLVYWRQVEGKWRLAWDIWNSDLPATPPPEAK